MSSPNRQFASDNTAGAHPEVLAAIAAANAGHAGAYSDDPYTARAVEAFRQHFGAQAEVFLVFNGTAANVLALKHIVKTYQAVVCSAESHVWYDECGAAEAVIGCKLLPVPPVHGKLTPDAVRPWLERGDDAHASQPKVISIAQTTEVGTVYTAAEVSALADLAHARGVYLHMDGARVANAAAALDVPLAAFTRDAGVDVLSFGGTKNGLMFGEAVVFLNPVLAVDFKFTRMQGLQLASKMRFIGAQFEALLRGDLWLRNARNANKMASLLARLVREVPGVEVAHEPQANAVFARVPVDVAARLRERYAFHTWDTPPDTSVNEVRWMCGFDATEADVRAFADAVRRAFSQ